MHGGNRSGLNAGSAAGRRPYWRYLLAVVAGGTFALYAASQREALVALWQQVQPAYLALLAVPAALVLWTQGKIFQRGCRELGTLIDEREAFALAVLTTAGNYVGALRLGAMAKAVYLKRSRGLAITDTLAVLGSTSLVGALSASACALALLVQLHAWRTPGGVMSAIALVAIIAVLLALLLAPPPRLDSLARAMPASVRERLQRLAQAWSVVGTPRLVVSLFLWHLVSYLFAAAGFYIAFELVLHRELSFGAVVTFTVATSMASLVALTPANLGLQELLIVAVAHSTQLGQEAGVVVAGALRLVQLTLLVLLMPLAWLMIRSGSTRTGVADAPPSQA